jgi:SNF2 family DNA or RNA helicase
MLRRTKTQTIGGKPLLSLPGRTVQVIECEFDDDERAFYKALEERTSVTINKFVRRGEVMKNYTSMLLLLLRLRQGQRLCPSLFVVWTALIHIYIACDHPSLISKDFTKDQEAIDMRPATTKEDGEGSDDGADELAAMMGKISVTPKCDICQAE